MSRIRWTLAVVGLTACGRIGFGAHTVDDAGADGIVPGGDAASDATSDAMELVVPATPIAGFDATGTTPATTLAIARTGGAVAIGWLGPLPSAMWGVAVDAANVPTTATPTQTSPTLGSTYGYRDLSLVYDGSHLLGMVSVPDDTLYLKTIAPDMTMFFTADSEVGHIAVPAFASAGAQWMGLYLTNGRPVAMPLNGDGRRVPPSTLLTDTSYVGATLASTGSRTLAVLATASGDCAVVSINGALAPTFGSLGAPCAAPHLASRGDQTALVAFEAAGGIAISRLTPEPVTATPPQVLATVGRAPRVAAATGYCVYWIDDGIRVAQPTATGFTLGRVTGVPAGPPDAYDVAGDVGFALWGTTLYRFPGCP